MGRRNTFESGVRRDGSKESISAEYIKDSILADMEVKAADAAMLAKVSSVSTNRYLFLPLFCFRVCKRELGLAGGREKEAAIYFPGRERRVCKRERDRDTGMVTECHVGSDRCRSCH